ncbi:peptidoglycan editing factor PgeF [Rhizohabitans arisaemae]|uniref:peptidoglycan editing factor PgeF n=1 Tax=Rhizohabitans arisaemae TaxID=2720610 RepID=UPI0024B2062F|nr:peptidoglycan editing factor PgeF [Rhizohabitans arisaemae]
MSVGRYRVLLAGRVHVHFTDRLGGASAPPYDTRNLGGRTGDDPGAVRRNRESTARELGVDPGAVVYMRQVHGADTRYVREPFGRDAPPLDAIYTDRPGLALAALGADCAPVLIGDPDAGIVGAAHSGRVGTAAGVVPALVEAMTAHGAEAARMVAVVGPAICGGCYEVSAQVRDEVCAVVPEAWATTRSGTPSVDVRSGIAAQLARAGVGEIRHDDRCTAESPELYSYRRDGDTGRFAGYVWLK